MRTALVVVLCVSGGLVLSAPAGADQTYFGRTVVNLVPPKMPVAAQGAAVSPDGTVLYVTDTIDRVLEYSTFTGSYLGGWGSSGSGTGQFGSAQFKEPHGIATDPFGNVWVADTGNNRVLKFTSSGTFLKSFSTGMPIGVAATSTRVYVLSGLFRAVDVRSLAGKDLGAFIATFPKGYDNTNHYGTPTNSADGITTDAGGNAVVAGTVSQPLVDSDRSFCQSPMQDYNPLRPLPDTLYVPAVATFSPTGANLGQAFTFNPGALCWTDSQDAWSYGRGDRHATGSVAINPSTGVAWTDTAENGYNGWASSAENNYLPLWESGFGPTTYNALYIYNGYGPIRALAIGCDSTMYFVADSIIQRITNSAPNASRCRVQKIGSTIQLIPALGATPPPGPGNKLTFNAICHSGTTCGGVLHLLFTPCAKCRPNLSIKKPIRISPGRPERVSIKLPAHVVNALRNGHPLTASATIGTAKAVLPLRLPISLTASCGNATGAVASARSFIVAGALSPARPGLRVQVAATGPDGIPVLLAAKADRHGHWSVAVSAPADGAWTVVARLPGTRTLAPAQSDCGTVVGNPMLTQLLALGGQGSYSKVDLTLGCPGAATPGQNVRVTGTVDPAIPTDPVSVTVTAPDGTSSSSSAMPGDDGSFATQFTPAVSGTWTVNAQANRAGAPLTQTCSVPVARVKTALTLTCPKSAIPYPGTHQFDGTLSPAVAGATVTVTFTPQPGSGQSTTSATGTVDGQGNYTATFNEPAPGQWTAKASWQGDAANEGATSSDCVVMVG